MTIETKISEAEFWRGRLVRWSHITTEDLLLRDVDRSYLEHVGLPVDGDWTLDFHTPTDALVALCGERSLVPIGTDSGMPICIDYAQDGRIVCLDESRERGRFVNSSIRQLGRFVLLFEQYRIDVRTTDDDGVNQLIDEVEQEMRAVDADALSGGEHYWSAILAQLRDGLL